MEQQLSEVASIADFLFFVRNQREMNDAVQTQSDLNTFVLLFKTQPVGKKNVFFTV